MLLFFKEMYRGPILRGEKRDTIRRPSAAWRIGRIMQACVGPSRIFARLQITAIEMVEEMDADRAQQVRNCLDSCDEPLVRLRFEVLPPDNEAA